MEIVNSYREKLIIYNWLKYFSNGRMDVGKGGYLLPKTGIGRAL